MFLILCVGGGCYEQEEKRCLLGYCCFSAGVYATSCSKLSHWCGHSVWQHKSENFALEENLDTDTLPGEFFDLQFSKVMLKQFKIPVTVRSLRTYPQHK